MKEPLCGACFIHPAYWRNSVLLGVDVGLCKACVVDWYEHQITDPTMMRERRVAESEALSPTPDEEGGR